MATSIPTSTVATLFPLSGLGGYTPTYGGPSYREIDKHSLFLYNHTSREVISIIFNLKKPSIAMHWVWHSKTFPKGTKEWLEEKGIVLTYQAGSPVPREGSSSDFRLNVIMVIDPRSILTMLKMCEVTYPKLSWEFREKIKWPLALAITYKNPTLTESFSFSAFDSSTPLSKLDIEYVKRTVKDLHGSTPEEKEAIDEYITKIFKEHFSSPTSAV